MFVIIVEFLDILGQGVSSCQEKNQMKQAYDMRFHDPLCYSFGVQGHVRRDCFKFIQEANHRRIRLMRFDRYEDDAMIFHL